MGWRAVNNPSGSVTVYDESIALTPRSGISFQGAGVAATDDAVNGRTIVTVTGAGSNVISPWQGGVAVLQYEPRTTADGSLIISTAARTTGATYDSTEQGFWTPLGIDTTDLEFVAVNAQSGSYTLIINDQGKAVEINSASPATVTIPANANVAFPIGTVVEITRMGSGTVTVAAGAGVTLRAPDGLLALRVQYSSVALRKRATDEWVVSGDVS